jgi:RNA polymerase sigma-B factor
VLRARAIEDNLPLARRLARRYAGRGEAQDDLTQVAAMALIKAVDGYDPTRSIPFASYAGPTITGALKRHFRDAAWAVHVPRSTQELVLLVRNESDHLSQHLGHAPTRADLAGHLGVTVDRIVAAEGAVSAYRPRSLDAAPIGDDGLAGTEFGNVLGDVDPRFAAVDDRLALRALVIRLPAREREILAMRFGAEMTQSQIAAAIGVSQMHVSRLLSRCLARLEIAMTSPGGRP